MPNLRAKTGRSGAYPVFGLILFLAGCGGADLGGTSRSSSFDNNLTGNYSGFSGNPNGNKPMAGIRARGTYARVEMSFEIPDLKGNPFDFTENDVQVSITRPDGQNVVIPAFFDGGKTWRVRYSPDAQGRYAVARVTLNGKDIQPDKLDKKEFEASGSSQPGFIRRDPKDKHRFAYDNGNTYFPIGNDLAWDKGITAQMVKMNAAGENWARIWMCHWDGKNLDWVMDKKIPLGTLDLDVAKRWDDIVEAAEKNNIRFQMVLQHHGQYSTRVDPNWSENPWNVKNGGFLNSPDEFFTNSRAISLTKAKYRYIVARWGYSPAIMAWELFNEVEGTDAVEHGHSKEVEGWHNEMAEFLRKQDPYKHLVTSSSGIMPDRLGNSLDYWQLHSYPPDAVSTIAGFDASKLDRPAFFGEIGPGEGGNAATFLHSALWASMMSECSGEAQFWFWDQIEKNNLYGEFKSASDFIRQSGISSKSGLMTATAGLETKARGPIDFAPGGGWEKQAQSEFTVLPSGSIQGLSKLPSYFQGVAHRDMFGGVTFKVNYPENGTFAVRISRSSKSGGSIVVSVDGEKAAEKSFEAQDADTTVNAVLDAKVSAGAHTIKVENTGADWVVVSRFTLNPYAPVLGVMGRSGKDYAALWITNRGSSETAETGKLSISGLQAGEYTLTWWDTGTGKVLSEENATLKNGPLTVNTPPVSKDIAVYIQRTQTKTGAKPSRQSLSKRDMK